MKKNKFEAPLMEIILINATDIVTGSVQCVDDECSTDTGGGGDGSGNDT